MLLAITRPSPPWSVTASQTFLVWDDLDSFEACWSLSLGLPEVSLMVKQDDGFWEEDRGGKVRSYQGPDYQHDLALRKLTVIPLLE